MLSTSCLKVVVQFDRLLGYPSHDTEVTNCSKNLSTHCSNYGYSVEDGDRNLVYFSCVGNLLKWTFTIRS